MSKESTKEFTSLFSLRKYYGFFIWCNVVIQNLNKSIEILKYFNLNKKIK